MKLGQKSPKPATCGTSTPYIPSVELGQARAILAGVPPVERLRLLAALTLEAAAEVQSSAPEPADDRWLSVNEFAEIVGQHPQTIRKLTRAGLIPAEDIRRKAGQRAIYRYRRSAADAYVSRNRQPLRVPRGPRRLNSAA